MSEPLTGEEMIEAADTYFLSDDKNDNGVDVLLRLAEQVKRIADMFEEALKEARREWQQP
jgi:hypothetical protein